MTPRFSCRIFAGLLLSVACVHLCYARLFRLWSYEDLVAEAETVALVEPVDNQPATDAFTGYGYSTNDFLATNTRFKVHAVLKGAAAKELTVLHFSYSTNIDLILNGGRFIRFPSAAQSSEQNYGRQSQENRGPGSEPPKIWLAFLKRRTDGRFEPLTGHYDSARAFREVYETPYYSGRP